MVSDSETSLLTVFLQVNVEHFKTLGLHSESQHAYPESKLKDRPCSSVPVMHTR